jgi:hypothetical protein
MLVADPELRRIHVPSFVGAPPPPVAAPAGPATGDVRQRSTIRRSILAAVPLSLAVAATLAQWLPTPDLPAAAVAPPANAAEVPAFNDVVSWADYFTAMETPRTITVVPVVSPEPSGFLVADVREAQIRHYTPSGRLAKSFGRRGAGPGEFTALSSAIHLEADRLLATDMNGRLTTFTNDGTVLRTDQAPLTPLYGAVKLNDSTVVLMGRSRGDGQKFLLHFWDTSRHAVRGSFFPEPAHRPELDDAYRFIGFPHVAVRGTRIAAIFAVGQEVRIFDGTGAQIGEIPIPFQGFRPLSSPIPSSEAAPEAMQKWIESFSVASRLAWLEDGSFLVQYFDKVGQEPHWRLLQMSPDGRPLFEGASPKLLSVLPKDVLLFDAPALDEPNVWQFASVSGTPGR